MNTLGIILIVYGLFCIMVALLKLPIIWNMGKLKIMAKMFGGDRNLQIFLIVWGVAAAVVGYLIR